MPTARGTLIQKYGDRFGKLYSIEDTTSDTLLAAGDWAIDYLTIANRTGASTISLIDTVSSKTLTFQVGAAQTLVLHFPKPLMVREAVLFRSAGTGTFSAACKARAL